MLLCISLLPVKAQYADALCTFLTSYKSSVVCEGKKLLMVLCDDDDDDDDDDDVFWNNNVCVCVCACDSSDSEDSSHACHKCICTATVAEEDRTDGTVCYSGELSC